MFAEGLRMGGERWVEVAGSSMKRILEHHPSVSHTQHHVKEGAGVGCYLPARCPNLVQING